MVYYRNKLSESVVDKKQTTETSTNRRQLNRYFRDTMDNKIVLHEIDLIEDTALKLAEFARSLREDVKSGSKTPEDNSFVMARREARLMIQMLTEIETML